MENLDILDRASRECRKHFVLGTFFNRWRFRETMRILKIHPFKTIMVHPHVLYDDEYLNVTISYIVKRLKKLGSNSKVVFFHPDEGYHFKNLHFYDKIAKYLAAEHSVLIKNMLYISAAADTHTNKVWYNKYCAEFNLWPLPMINVRTFETLQDDNLLENYSPATKETIEKKFICLNRMPRPHRLAVISEILKRGLREDCYLSLDLHDRELPMTGDKEALRYFFPNLADDMISRINSIECELPWKLTLEKDSSNLIRVNASDLKIHRSSLFSLVNETVFFSSKELYQNPHRWDIMMCFPCMFFTEKTWRCVNLKHPFVLCSVPGSLAALRELGYKTFQPYINESYDLIANDEERLLAIMDEVERLCNMSDSETDQWIAGVTEICEYNHNHLASKQCII